MAKIISPVEGYSGVSASVQFKDGVGHTDNPHLINWFREKGYLVVEELAQKPTSEPELIPESEPELVPEPLPEPEPEPETPPAKAEPKKKHQRKV